MVLRGAWLAFLGMIVAQTAYAEEGRVKAAVDEPAAIVASPRRAANAEPPQVVVSIVGFMPSQAGPVQAVVTYAVDGQTKVLGRISIFPQHAFDASQPAKAQLFGFPLPTELDADRPLALAIKVEPTQGSGKGAAFVIGSAAIE